MTISANAPNPQPATNPCTAAIRGVGVRVAQRDVSARPEDPYQHVSISGPVIEMWDDPALEVMDRLSMRYTGEPWPEREGCVSALVEIERWHTYGVLSEASDYSSAEQSQ
ncbi:MAG: hypothetical protein WBP81_07290 [Solirubrobacteraceae bacterium]